MSPNQDTDTVIFEHATTLSLGASKKEKEREREREREKGRKFFQQIEPTFAVRVPTAPYTELQFLDNFDPGKDAIIRKKAREWVNRNKERTALNGKSKPRAKSNAEKAVGKEQEEQLAKKRANSKALVASPQTISASSVDPFGLLPDIGRNFDHIIKYFFSSQCPEEIPCSDDKYADKPKCDNNSVVVFRRENTILGNMVTSELTFILWLYATVSIRNGILGVSNTEEAQWLYSKALKGMQAAVKKATEDGDYSIYLLKSLACITATASVSGMFKTAEIHRDALVKTLALRGDGDILAGLKSAGHFTTKASQWCELLVAAQNAETPKIPYFPQKSAPLPSRVEDEAAVLTATTLTNLPTLSKPLPRIVQLLHQISVGWTRPPPGVHVDSFIIQPLYDVVHTILRTLAAQKEPDNNYSQAEVLLTEAFQLYFWITSRRLPPLTRLSNVLISRLMKALLPLLLEATTERAYEGGTESVPTCPVNDGEDPVAAADYLIRFLSYPRETNNAITWALALGTFVTAPLLAPEQAWFKTHLKLQLRAMALDKSEAEWHAFLGLFPATEGFPWVDLAGLYKRLYT